MTTKLPPHPGRSIRTDYLEPRCLTVTDAARHLGVTPQALNKLVNGQVGISAEMALRLEAVFGFTAEHWLALQARYDLARLRAGNVIHVSAAHAA